MVSPWGRAEKPFRFCELSMWRDERGATMAMMIGDDCIGCSGCVDECPNMAISLHGEGYVIDPHRCTECVGAFPEPQCAAVCPTVCIVPHPDHRETAPALAGKRRVLLAS